MDPHYYDPAWTQSVGYGPSVNEHTERPTFAHSYKQPHVLSDGFENLYQGPPDSSAGQGSMQQGSGFYVRPATIMTSVSTGEPSLQGYGSAAPVNSVAHAVSLSDFVFIPLVLRLSLRLFCSILRVLLGPNTIYMARVI